MWVPYSSNSSFLTVCEVLTWYFLNNVEACAAWWLMVLWRRLGLIDLLNSASIFLAASNFFLSRFMAFFLLSSSLSSGPFTTMTIYKNTSSRTWNKIKFNKEQKVHYVYSTLKASILTILSMFNKERSKTVSNSKRNNSCDNMHLWYLGNTPIIKNSVWCQ